MKARTTAHSWAERGLGREVSHDDFAAVIGELKSLGTFDDADVAALASHGSVPGLHKGMKPIMEALKARQAQELEAVGFPPGAGPIRHPEQWHAAKGRALAHAAEKIAEARAAGADDLATTLQNIRDEKTEAGKQALRQSFLNTHPEHADLGERLMSGTLMKGR